MYHQKYGHWRPHEIAWLQRLEKIARKSRDEEWRETNARTRLLRRLKKDCVTAKIDGWYHLPGTWMWNDTVVFQMETMSWGDCEDSGDYLQYLTKFYVLDSERGKGTGTAFLNQLKRWMDDTGSVVFFFACSYGLSGNGRDAYGFHDMNQLLKYWAAQRLVETESTDVLLRWYKRLGFQNACVHATWHNAAKEEHELKTQFLYIGDKLQSHYKEQIRKRLSADGMCDHCKKQIHSLHQ